MPMMQDLLWISKQQQQHPSTHAHPLKNTIRVSFNGTRHKFDGKQWRPLCESPDGPECRNLAFRSALCQKHFYKTHLCKPPAPLPEIPRLSLKRSLIDTQEHCRDSEEEDDDSVQFLENPSSERNSPPARSHFRVNGSSLSDADPFESNCIKGEPVSARFVP